MGPSPFQKRPPHTPSDRCPPDEPTHALLLRIDPLIGAVHKVWQPRDLVWAVYVHHLPSGPKTFLHKGCVVAVHDTEVFVEWATDKNHTKVTASEVHEKEEAAWAAFHKAQMSSYPGSTRGTRSGNSNTYSKPALFPKSATQLAPLPSPTPQETPAKVPPPPQQETQGALVPIEGADVEVFQNRLGVKVGWRAYLVPRNHGGNLDCDQATCTQLEKCRGGREQVTRCLDAQNRNFAQRVNADRLTCIFVRVFGKWMTEADILELSG